MNERADQELLRDYAENRSDAAFTTLVQRHIDLVHSAAWRMTTEAHSAQDVTQAVFIALAQQAAQLANHPVLSGWLHTTARQLAAKHVRAAVRRQTHEQEAAAMNELLSPAPNASWEEIAPHLDAALGELSEPDRDAVLLRYFEKYSAAEIGSKLGISSDAAQKRVSRAVERLREFFVKRGVAIGTSGLAVVVSANAVQAAPAGLVVTISTAALAGTTAATSTIIATITKTIAMTTFQKTLVTATVAVLAGAGIYEAHQAAQLRDQVRRLEQQQAPLREQLQQLQAGLPTATDHIATATPDSNEELKAEVLRLRGLANRAQSAEAELAALKSAQQQQVQNAQTTTPQLTQEQISSRIETAVTNQLSRLASRLALTDGQSQSVADILRTTNAGFERDSKIRAVLSPDQQNAYDTFKEEELRPSLVIRAGAALSDVQKAVDLSADQQDQAFATAFQSLRNSMMQISKASSQADATALAQQMKDQQIAAVESVLTPDQVAQYRAYLGRKAGVTSRQSGR